ncbi:hypothetical protein [Frigidibacter sp. ROC022]|uniref:hypothetical protein n=1 Tax=Frigidibacter sp. ROC022 TaxID=2971796 RepID=UPI00215A2776|nr:hypothetical protein [Frigidibacter sp. ROC022]MCR8724692.1 hypothetical protein [Frigidibacter sp. ROC022]
MQTDYIAKARKGRKLALESLPRPSERRINLFGPTSAPSLDPQEVGAVFATSQTYFNERHAAA